MYSNHILLLLLSPSTCTYFLVESLLMVAIGMSVNIWGFGQVHVQLSIQVYFIDYSCFDKLLQ